MAQEDKLNYVKCFLNFAETQLISAVILWKLAGKFVEISLRRQSVSHFELSKRVFMPSRGLPSVTFVFCQLFALRLFLFWLELPARRGQRHAVEALLEHNHLLELDGPGVILIGRLDRVVMGQVPQLFGKNRPNFWQIREIYDPEFAGLALDWIEADYCRDILTEKLLSKYMRFTSFCTSKSENAIKFSSFS